MCQTQLGLEAEKVRTKQRLWLDKYSRAVSNGVWGLLGRFKEISWE